MTSLTYTQLMNEGFRQYRAGRYIEAYELVTRLAPSLMGNKPQVYNFRFCLASIAGKHDLALQIMHEAIIENGFWYSKEFLDDSDLDPIRKTRDFKQLAEVCSEREAARRKSSFESRILEPPSWKEDSTLIALHGNGQNLRLAEGDWDHCLKKGYALALLQSSQISFTDGFYWNDFEKGTNELHSFWKHLENQGSNLHRSIVGGFSAGARVALYSLLTRRIRPKAFILVGPWIPEIAQWGNLMDNLDKGIKGFIICGDKDEDCFELAKKSFNMLSQREISTHLEVIRGLDHDFPRNFPEILDEIIDSLA